jgi:hypothetical protein
MADLGPQTAESSSSFSSLPWQQRWALAEAEAHIEFGITQWNGCDPKVCGLIAIKWLKKVLS